MERTSTLSGLAQPGEVVRLLEVTTRALAACLAQPDRQRWAATLPRPLAELFLATPYDGTQRAADVYAAVTRSEGVHARFGMEHAQAAIRALASDLSADTARLMARHLPAELGELLLALPHGRPSPEHADAPPQPDAGRPAGAIANAAGGSRHPVSEAEPKAAQSGSVGAWDEARMDHTLGSGALDTDADRPDGVDSLAAGRPGSKRSLSGE